MTADRDIERLLDAWLADGPMQVSDHAFDDAVGRVYRQRQRPAWRIPWREPHVTTYVRFAAGMAAIALVAIVGINLLGSASRPGIGGPAPSPSPTATAEPTPSATGISSTVFRPGLRAALPADWHVAGEDNRSFFLAHTAEPSGSPPIEIQLMNGPFVEAPDRDCEGRHAAGIGASAAQVVASLSSDPGLTTTSAGTINLGNRTGKALDIEVASGWTGTCGWSQGEPAVLLLMATDQGPGFGVGGTEKARLIVVDVDTKVVSIIISSGDGSTQDSVVARAMPIVESIEFVP